MDHKKDREKHFTVFSIDSLGTKKPEQFLYLEEKHIYFFVRIPDWNNTTTNHRYLCSKISMPETGGLAMKLFITNKVTHGRSWFFGQEMTTRRDTFWIEQKDLYLELSKDLFKYERITKMVNEFMSSLLKKSGIHISGKFVSFTKPFRDFISRNNLLQIVDIITQQSDGYIEEKSFNKVSHLVISPLKGLTVIDKIELPEKRVKGKKIKTKILVKIIPPTRTNLTREIVQNITSVRKSSNTITICELISKRSLLINTLIEKNLLIKFKNSIRYSDLGRKKIIITDDMGRNLITTTVIHKRGGPHKNQLLIDALNKILEKLVTY